MDTFKFRETKSESEYFYKQNLELIKNYRAKIHDQRLRLKEKHEKSLHWMKCPKCGHDLAETNMAGVLVDLCQDCGGIFLDQGELELLKNASEHQSFFTIINSFYQKSSP